MPGSPSFEAWTTYEGAGASLADLNALQITVPNGPVHWLTGLQGDTADVPTDSAFTLQQQALASSQSLSLGATHRASEKTVPWFSIDGARDEFYVALDVVRRLVGDPRPAPARRCRSPSASRR